MPTDYSTLAPTHMRRSDRGVEDETWIKTFLHRAAWGVMATSAGGQPFVNSNLFVYDEERHALYLHTARSGRTPANVAANPRVCFHVAEMGRLLPADVALEFSVEYAGVTLFGRASLVSNDEEMTHGLQQLLDKYAPHLKSGRDYQPIAPEDLARTAVYRIDIDSWSGKRKAAAADFAGAFFYPQ